MTKDLLCTSKLWQKNVFCPGSSDTRLATLLTGVEQMSDSASLQKLSWLAVEFWDMREGMEKRGKELSEDLRDLTEELLVEPDLVLAKKWFDRDLLFVILPGLPFLCFLLG